MMRTTVNLPLFIRTQITQLLKETTIREDELIARCLARYVKKICRNKANCKSNSLYYQPRGLLYKPVHVTFCWKNYDMHRLSRFVFRVSISSMATEAIRLYAEEIVRTLNQMKAAVVDNYFIKSFDIDDLSQSESVIYTIKLEKQQE